MSFKSTIIITSVVVSFVFAACSNNEKPAGQAQETTTSAPAPEKATNMPAYMVKGEKVYMQNCLTCHQATGQGVPGMNPPLKQTEYVLGDKERLISILLKGSNVGLNVNGNTYSNSMPSQSALSDEDIADVLSYVRGSFGNTAGQVTPDEVKNVRATTK